MSVRLLLIIITVVAVLFPAIQHALLMAFLIAVGLATCVMIVVGIFDLVRKDERWDS